MPVFRFNDQFYRIPSEEIEKFRLTEEEVKEKMAEKQLSSGSASSSDEDDVQLYSMSDSTGVMSSAAQWYGGD